MISIFLAVLAGGLLSALILLFWYTITLLKKLMFVSKNMYRMHETFEFFKKHLEGIYELETFYGDQDIKNLIIHSKDVVDEINKFQDIYVLSEDGELEQIIMELDEEEEKNDNNKEEKKEEE